MSSSNDDIVPKVSKSDAEFACWRLENLAGRDLISYERAVKNDEAGRALPGEVEFAARKFNIALLKLLKFQEYAASLPEPSTPYARLRDGLEDIARGDIQEETF